jgi:hypothetical protein
MASEKIAGSGRAQSLILAYTWPDNRIPVGKWKNAAVIDCAKIGIQRKEKASVRTKDCGRTPHAGVFRVAFLAAPAPASRGRFDWRSLVPDLGIIRSLVEG